MASRTLDVADFSWPPPVREAASTAVSCRPRTETDEPSRSSGSTIWRRAWPPFVAYGGKVVVPAFSISGVGRGCYITDPVGLLIGLHHYDPGTP